jgi:hypothetical protein
MAEPHPKGKQPSAPKNPSRLKNQVNPESVPDDVASEHASYQVLDSQTVVPETQYDDSENFGHAMENRSDYGELPLSPYTAALLDRSTIKKSTEPIGIDPFADVPYFDRAFDRLPREESVRFTFAQPKKSVASSQLESKAKAMNIISQPTVEFSPALNVTTDALHQTVNGECTGDLPCTGFY